MTHNMEVPYNISCTTEIHTLERRRRQCIELSRARGEQQTTRKDARRCFEAQNITVLGDMGCVTRQHLFDT